ncbi:MAG: hypothetical protein ABIB43_00550 [archaeon]
MKLYKVGIKGGTLIDFERDKNFNIAVYLSEEDTYLTATPFEFQDTNILKGHLRERPYFIVRGKEIVGGKNFVEVTVKDYNDLFSKSLNDLKSTLKTQEPRFEIYDTLDNHIKACAKEIPNFLENAMEQYNKLEEK